MKIFIFCCSVLLGPGLIAAQCPDKDEVWTRLKNIKSLKQPHRELLSGFLSTRDSLNRCGRTNDSIYIYLLRKIADLYVEQSDFIKAVEYRRKAIEITSKNAENSSVKQSDLPGIYYWLSVAYDSLDNFSAKMNALDSSAAIALRMKIINRASLLALYTRVEYYFDIGDYHRCIDYAILCEQLGSEFSNSLPAGGADYAYSSLGWHVEALLKLKMFGDAESILVRKINEYKKAGLINYIALVYEQLAQVNEQKGNIEKSLIYFNQSLHYYEQDKDYFNSKQTLKDIGYKIYFKHLNNNGQALSYYHKALVYPKGNLFTRTADNFESLNIYTNIGAIFVQEGLYDSAYKYFQYAFDQVRPGSGENDILNSSLHEIMQFKRNYYLTDLLINKANAFRKQFRENKQKNFILNAIRIYKVADQLLDRFKTEQTELESKLFWRSDSRRLYENAIAACFEINNTSDAFYFFEKSRAVLLNDQLNENKFMGARDMMQQTEIRKKIHQLQIELSKTGNSPGLYSNIQQQLFELKQQSDRLQDLIKIKNPLYYQSFLDTSLVSEEKIRGKVLKDHVALVEIFNGDSGVYVLLLTEQISQLKRLEKSAYEKLVATFNQYVSDYNLLNRNYETFITISRELYHAIFGNISIPPGRLVVSPDGQYFPFEALVVNKQPFTWFLNNYAVSYTYSARYLLNLFDKPAGNTRNLMGMAPVNYPPAFELGSLPGSDKSLQQLKNYVSKIDNLAGSEASRNNFLKKFGSFKIVQLYTHSADSSDHNEPVIYFADSALYLSELVTDNQPATRLIVLAACETGKGKAWQGEGVFSFNRGFASLGIPAAIANLWSVDNKATYTLTELFYKYLSGGLPTDIALQKAKLEYLSAFKDERSLPCYWAAAVLVGQTGTIPLDKSFSWWWVILVAGIIILSFLGRKKIKGNIRPFFLP